MNRFVFLSFCILLIPFSIFSQSITITSPDGGESWAGCTNQNITWVATGTSGDYSIDYSADGGTTWTSVATFYNTAGGSFSWTVPNVSSTQVKIRVRDSNNPSIEDESNAFFTMIGPLILSSPNGGENTISGTTLPIVWQATNTSDRYNIQYSLNAGVSWINIVTNHNNTSEVYNWTVPNTPSTTCLVRITDVNNSCMTDKSDHLFTILSDITLTAPNGGEVWQGTVGAPGGSYNMSTASVETNNGWFYDQGGANGNYFDNSNIQKTFYPDAPGHKLRFDFEEFYTYHSSDYLRIYNGPSTSYPLIGTYSTTNNPGTVTSTHASGALTFYFVSNSYSTGSGWKARIITTNSVTKDVSWAVTGTSGKYNIDYSTNGGTSWVRVETDYETVSGLYEMNVPNTPSTNCLMRVIDAENGNILDQSDAVFTITDATPELIEPNGGEDWLAGTVHTVEWAKTLISSSVVVIEYSVDNGQNWTQIVSGTTNDGSYDWLIPSNPSTECLVRVSAFGNASVTDQSDAVFTIAPYITVTSPDGGESLNGCASHTIRWRAGGTTNSYDIEYTTDNGATWQAIVSNYSTSASNASYTWSLMPNISSSQVKVRVTDAGDPSKTDESDALLSLVQTANAVVSDPNGGEITVTGTLFPIVYLTDGPTTNVRLEYSVNNGTSWSNIISNTSGGVYNWTVPNTPSEEVLIRVTDVSNTCNRDVSDAAFEIVSEVEITAPNGGEVLTATVGPHGSTYNMSTATVETNNGWFYDQGGANGNYFDNSNIQKTFYPDVPGNHLRFDFESFSTYHSSDYLRIYNGPSTSYPLIGTYSTTNSPGVVTSTHSSGALTFYFVSNSYSTSSGWRARISTADGTVVPVSWDITGTSKEFDLEYSINNGTTWITIESDYPSLSGDYSWHVPNTPSIECLFRSKDSQNGAIVDVSDAVFTIERAQPKLIAPDGGERWLAGTNHEIEWAEALISTSVVTIEFSVDNGITWQTIVSGTTNDGTYAWVIPNQPSTECLVRVSEFDNPSTNDVSDAVFIIDPHIRVTSPNGAESINGCESQTIRWTAGGTSNNYTIEYTIDNGSTWTILNSNYSTSATNASYTWSPLPNLTSTNVKVRVTDVSDGTKTDESDATFTLNKTNYVDIQSPQGGENMITGTLFPIVYSTLGPVSNIRLQYSLNSGVSWTNIVSSTNGGVYNWTVPNTPTETAKIRGTDVSNSCNIDDSDSLFTIVSEVEVIEPNGGEVIQAQVGLHGSSYNMSTATVETNNGWFYDQGGANGNYLDNSNILKTFYPDVPTNKLQFNFESFYTYHSSDYLRIYNGPSTSFPLIGTYSTTNSPGTVTSTHSSGALTFHFVSNSYSTSSGWSARIKSTGGTTVPIDWSITGTSGVYDLDYSTNGGTTWKVIESDLESLAGDYEWNPPCDPSQECLVRVTDASNGQILDQSDNFFTLTRAQPLLIEPNGGETWLAGTVHEIEWAEALFCSSVVVIEYSTDGGSTWSAITTGTNNDGLHSWTIPNIPTAEALVRVSEFGHMATSDVSDAFFTIQPHVQLTSPDGGETLLGCGSHTIRWTAGGTSNNYKIEYSIDNGSTWIILNSNYNTSATNATYSWSPLPNLSSNQVIVRVTDVSDPAKSDESDAVLSLVQTANVTINSPNGGESTVAGTLYPVVYSTDGPTTNVRLEYSLNSGATWSNIISNHSGGVYNWTVPNLPSATAMLRGTDVSNTCNRDQSDSVFTIQSEITVVEPNGGEVITATVGPHGGNYNMSTATVTTNNGFFYDQGGANGNYFDNSNILKTFHPDVPGNKLKFIFESFYTYHSSDYLRIYNGPSTSYPLIGTYSTTNSPATVVSTHSSGALTFHFVSNSYSTSSGWQARIVTEGGTTSQIEWNTIGTSGEFDIDLSINGGTTWSRIEEAYTSLSGIYEWNCPHLPTTEARVRVKDAQNGAIVDMSDADFTILSAQPLLLEPNGGEQIIAGTAFEIEWTEALFANSVVLIEYSTDNGSTWNTVASGTNNDGSYTWIMPNTPSPACIVRISDFADPNLNDVSDAVFTILPHVTITAPNGGETWQGCSSQVIRWRAGGTSNNYKIEYSIDNGVNWTILNSNYSTSATNATYSWNPLPNIAAANVIARVTDVSDPSKTDMSDASFSMQKTTNAVMHSPNGGEQLVTGTIFPIVYSTDGPTTNVRIQYSVNGSTWTNIISSHSGGVYNWTVPNVPSETVLVKVTDVSQTCNSDESDSVFSILSSIAVVSPNGGEVFTASVGPHGGTYNMSTATVETNNGWFHDQGGANGNYFDNSNIIKTFYPDVPDFKLRFDFESFYTYHSSDYLRIYDGPSTSYPLIGTFSTTNSPGTITASHSTGALTFYFVSNSYSTSSGWRARISTVGCASETIEWDITGTSNIFDLDYSIDGGLNWSRIDDEYESLSGSYEWCPPNTPTTNALVRVKDAQNGSIIDESDFAFTIERATPILLTPNGGENWIAGTAHDIEWAEALISSSVVTLEYSVDSGSTWSVISSGTNNDGSLNWVVPNEPSTACLVRVSEFGNPSVFDISDAVFTIAPHIDLTSPNGAEQILGCASQTIRWRAGGTSNLYDIEYSIDNGINWQTIVSNYSTSATNATYSWSPLPNLTSANMLVRVTDASDQTKTDRSESTFTLSKTSNVVIGSPNGGESAVTGTQFPIVYLTDGPTTNVRLQYSVNNGASWSNIVSSTSGGVYNWTIPNTPTDNAIVRGQDVSNSCNTDDGDSTFSIISEVAVIKPNGGEVWEATVGPHGGNYNMSTAAVKTNSGYFYDQGGASGNYFDNSNIIKTFYPDVPGNKLSFEFLSFYTYHSSDYLRIYDGPSTSYPLIGTFSTTNNPGTIVATHSTGALTFYFVSNSYSTSSGWSARIESVGGPTKEIAWSYTGTSTSYDIEYSTNNGASWSSIIEDYPSLGGTYNWSVPCTPSNQAKVRVLDASNHAVIDESDHNFTIEPAQPKLESPNGGETWFGQAAFEITWVEALFCGTVVRIELSTDNGFTWSTVIAGTNNDGSYSWSLPEYDQPMTQCLIRVSDFSEPSINDISDNTFTLHPSILLHSPNGDNGIESWRGCTEATITFTAGGTSNRYIIDYSLDNGASWIIIDDDYVNSSTNVSYDWTIPNTFSESSLVRVIDKNAPNKSDVSDSTFTISRPITLTQPNFGGALVGGTTTSITWEAEGVSNFYDISYSINGGATWTNLVFNENIQGTSYSWTVPNTASNNCLVKVTDNANNCKEDISDIPFAITVNPLNVVLVEPNGGEAFTGCETTTISWTASNTSGVYDLEYSIDGGGQWLPLVSNHASTSHSWQVPNLDGRWSLIRVKDANDPSKVDQSDASFSIEPSIEALVNVTGSLEFCQGGSVTLTSNQATGNLWMPGGSTDQSITITTAAVYTLTVDDGAGCSDQSQPLEVVVNPLPPTPFISTAGAVALCPGGTVSMTSSASSGNTWSSGELTRTIEVNYADDFFVTVQNNFGCTATSSTITTTVQEVPEITFTGSTSLCAGESLVLNSGISGTIWSPGSGLNNQVGQQVTATPATTTSYIATSTDGCNSRDTITVVVNQLPIASIQGTDAVTANTGSAVLTVVNGTAPFSYAWSNGESTRDIYNLNPGNYSVTVTDAYGCEDLATVVIGGSVCMAPVNLHEVNVTMTTARLRWNAADGADHYKLKGRQAGTNGWISLTVNDTSLFANILAEGTTYEWQVKTYCDAAETDSSDWSPLRTFTTQGGCQPTDSIFTRNISSSGARLRWNLVNGAHHYTIRGRRAGAGPWVTLDVTGSSDFKQVNGLAASTTYEWQLRTACSAGSTNVSAFTALTTFTTEPTAKAALASDDPFYRGEPILKISPNPNNGRFVLELAELEAEQADLTIFNLQGVQVYHRQLESLARSTKIELDLGQQLAKGVYLLQFNNAGTKVTERVVIH